MRNLKAARYILIVILFFICSGFLFSQDFITIYSDYQSAAYGRSAARIGIQGINLYEFKKFNTYPAGNKNGILTAVLVSSYVKSVLDDLFSNSEKVRYEDTEIFMVKRAGFGNIYKLKDYEYGLEFSFRLEKATPDIYREINKVYGNNSYWHQIVSKLYRKNYVVRIYSSERIKTAKIKSDSFSNAFFMATLIGDRHQPLWGIHDGLGYLDNIGYALIRRDIDDHSRFVDYRAPVVNSEILYRFITRIETMGDGFVQNLDAMTRSVIDISEKDSPLKIPEVLITAEKGTQTDIALFFYDILMRKGYECKLVVVKKAYEKSDMKLVVLFRDKISFKWGIIGDLPVSEEIHQDWRKSISNLYHQDMKYYLVNADEVFEDKLLSVPDGSDERYWKMIKY